MAAMEADRSVKFGPGINGYLVDPDIYTDGRISVQGIDDVLFPAVETNKVLPKASAVAKVVSKPIRGGDGGSHRCYVEVQFVPKNLGIASVEGLYKIKNISVVENKNAHKTTIDTKGHDCRFHIHTNTVSN
ncbi:hypothetical protein CASFOL_017838 [Castilleja foliolosa]|uniref:Uncharacterized protein n=1 Tax=Castilleja foliolosa TaxID=1961234 RepID=A0ABD3D9V3_9LAMI